MSLMGVIGGDTPTKRPGRLFLRKYSISMEKMNVNKEEETDD
jgi:hypothetical protein